ncbi:MAG: response regulator transcription factor [Nitriliruptorales bacterium]|nr:response regulator transcription factor [Nitriliruptorales bacterium]
MTTIRLMIAEDDLLVREGARALLDSEPSIELVGTAGDPASLLELVAADPPDVVITDIRMPPTFTTEGIELAKQLRAAHPKMGIVVLSQHADPEYALDLLKDGAEGFAYLLKERLGDADELVGAIHEAASGGSALDPKIVDGLLEAQRRRTRSRVAGLTPRQQEVLALMASGKGNAAIADALVISERAVEKHTNAIFRNLGLSNANDLNRRVAAVLFYLQRSVD